MSSWFFFGGGVVGGTYSVGSLIFAHFVCECSHCVISVNF